jgi:peroxiredoxin
MKKILSLTLLLATSAILYAQMDIKKPEGLKVGDKAPAIVGKDQNGKKVSLKEILKNGEAVLIFYRGQWCPYCNKQLSQLNDSLSYVTAKGGTIITITPETADNIKKTINKTKATYSILQDKGMVIMENYKVNFALDEKIVETYKGYGIDFEKANGENGANLPVPATYIIGKNGKIKYVFFNPDHTKRPSVKVIIDNL